MSPSARMLVYILVLCVVAVALAVASAVVGSYVFAWCCIGVGWVFVFEGWRQLRHWRKR